MRDRRQLQQQLRQVGHNNWFLARAEIQHLPEILLDDEIIFRIITGGCPDGIAVLVATNRRLLLIDKSPFTLDVEDFPYAHIANAEHKFGFIFGSLKISTINRELHFTRVNPRKIGDFAKFVHYKIREAADVTRRLTQQMNSEYFSNQPAQVNQAEYGTGPEPANPFVKRNYYGR